MNNAVSADVTLFSRVHPDIVKRISVSSVIVSALLAIGGIGAYSGGYPFSISGDIRSVPS